MSFWDLAQSGEFAAALGGAGAAFLLEAVRRRVADNSRQQAGVNMALLELSQMQTVLKNFHDQVFVDALPVLRAALGRDPHGFEYWGAAGLADEDLKIEFEHLSGMLISHDPGLMQAMYMAERTYLTNKMLMREHAELRIEFQRSLASKHGPTGAIAVAAIPGIVGIDLFKRLEHVAGELQKNLPRDCELIMGVADRLLRAAKLQYPTRRFIQFSVTDRFPVNSDKPTGQPAAWRAGTRWVTDQIRHKKIARVLALVATFVAAYFVAKRFS